MNNPHDYIGWMRDSDLGLHCTQVSIKQDKPDGLSISGYGEFKVNSVGTIHLEMVCTEGINIPISFFGKYYPEDPFDHSDRLVLSAIDLNGDTYSASEFSIKIGSIGSLPFVLHVFLHEIKAECRDIGEKGTDYLYFEISERCLVPPNVHNSVISSLGQESYSWNQTRLDLGSAKLSIVNHETHVTVSVSGQFNTEVVYESLLFYIGLTSGVLPQPHGVISQNKSESTLRLMTTRKALQNRQFSIPFPKQIRAQGWPECNHDLLKTMIAVRSQNRIYFDCTYGQWQRVWHASTCEKHVAALTLGVSIEGILNDIYIPKLEELLFSEEFEKQKNILIAKLELLDIDEAHKTSLSDFVGRWGNIHPGKAMTILVERGLITSDEKKAWDSLRNSAAHPKFVENSQARQAKEHKRTERCINVFFRLILNVFEYTGPQYEHAEIDKPKLVINPSIRILNITPKGMD